MTVPSYRPKIHTWDVFKFLWRPLTAAICGFGIGTYLDLQEDKTMYKYRDKSALYGGMRGPDDEPTWT